jgi:nitroreductase
MDVFEAINARRSVRKYRDEPVGREVLERIVAAGVEAPSGCNAQLRQYVIVEDPAVMERLRAVSPALSGAPAAIVLLVEPATTRFGEFWVQDASAAMENMLLAAVALGCAGCWVEGQVRRYEGELRAALGVPETLRVWSLTPIGRPAAVPARPPKPAAREVTHYNRFG